MLLSAASSDEPAAGISVRAAVAGDVRICRMLLPETDSSTDQPRFAVAIGGDAGKIVAAVAWARPPGDDARVWRVAIQVIAPFRNRGVESLLLAYVETQAESTGITALDCWNWVDADSDGERGQFDLGFRPIRRIYEFESLPVEIYHATLPLLAKVRARHRIPAGAEVVSLADADALTVATLHATQLGGAIDDILPLLRGPDPEAYDSYISTVLRVDGRVMGCNLFKWTGADCGNEDATIVDPSLRNTWAMLWLMNEHARRAVEQGVLRARFTTFKFENGERLVSSKSPLELVHTRVWMRMRLPAARGASGTRSPAVASASPAPNR